jgi:hypothetical protein
MITSFAGSIGWLFRLPYDINIYTTSKIISDIPWSRNHALLIVRQPLRVFGRPPTRPCDGGMDPPHF